MSVHSEPQVKRGLKAWTTRDLLVMIAIAIVLGLILAVLNFVYLNLMPYGPIVRDTISGFWFIPSIAVMYIVHRPGTAVLTRILVNIVQIPFSPFGVTELVVSVLFGAASEIPFLATRYRNFRLPVLLASGGLAGLLNFGLLYAFLGGNLLSWGVVVVWFIVCIVSGALLGGGGAKLLIDRIVKTGVLASFAVAQDEQ
ncbi:MAG: ECF transporter S component [Chloroflexota bacterium]